MRCLIGKLNSLPPADTPSASVACGWLAGKPLPDSARAEGEPAAVTTAPTAAATAVHQRALPEPCGLDCCCPAAWSAPATGAVARWHSEADAALLSCRGSCAAAAGHSGSDLQSSIAQARATAEPVLQVPSPFTCAYFTQAHPDGRQHSGFTQS